jgi:hypothetical protein
MLLVSQPVSSATALAVLSGEALAVGDVLSIASDGRVMRLDTLYVNNLWRPFAVALASTVGPNVTIPAAPLNGSPVSVRFAVAPLAADQGQSVWASDASLGAGSLVAPIASGHVVYSLGVVVVADGITTTPSVAMAPHYVTRRL